MGQRKGRSVRKNKQASLRADEEELARAPHSFVIHRGKTGKYVQELTTDFRQVMEPFTATSLKVGPKNVVKDFVHVAGMLKVTHLCMFTKTALGPYLKIARFPRGPTLTFKVKEYALGRDVRSSLKRQVTYDKQFLHHPLLVMNNFPSESREYELTASMFQNMFPTINVTKVKLNTIRRCVLLNYNKETGCIDFRHYTIKVVPVGVNRGVKKIVSSKIPNLGRLEDVADLLTKGGAVSDSEFEEDEASRVVLPQEMTVRGAMQAQQSSVRLVELGPRMSLQLLKIEDGMMDGEVMFHQYVTKTDEEVKAIRERREKRKKEKEKRKKEQEKNVKKKQLEKDRHKQRSLEGMAKKEPELDSKEKKAIKDWQGESSRKEGSDSDEDAEWYRKEVGTAPDRDLFEKSSTSKKPFTGGKRFSAKKKSKGPSFNEGDLRRQKHDSDKNKKKGRRKVKVFNSDGVGPNYKKGGGGGATGLRGVKAGRVEKRGNKAGRAQKKGRKPPR